ncbi:MAG: M48 metallopeptidase family protein [Gemmatimonadaceae bacterium]
MTADALSIRYWPSSLTGQAMARLEHVRLGQRVEQWSERLKVRPRVVRVQRMNRKWGSCSQHGTVTLAADLTEKTSGFQDFVIAHELLHLRIANHGRLFKSLMALHVPGWRRYDLERKAGTQMQSLSSHAIASASDTLRDRRTNKPSKSAAGSALSQKPPKK